MVSMRLQACLDLESGKTLAQGEQEPYGGRCERLHAPSCVFFCYVGEHAVDWVKSVGRGLSPMNVFATVAACPQVGTRRPAVRLWVRLARPRRLPAAALRRWARPGPHGRVLEAALRK